MSPILVRPVREQLEHDRVIRALQAKLKRKFDVIVNMGNESVAPVRIGKTVVFPDLVLTLPRKAGSIGGVVEVAVCDTGTGIPKADLPRLTERFYRVDKARSRELGGTGLGLAIVKHLVLAHGGELTIDSELWKGTMVRFTLPAAPPAA